MTVKSITMDVDGDGQVVLVNSGNIADELVSVSTVGLAPDSTPTAVAPTTLIMTPNGGLTTADFDLSAVAGEFDEGQIVTIKVNLKSGAQLTQSVIVTA